MTECSGRQHWTIDKSIRDTDQGRGTWDSLRDVTACYDGMSATCAIMSPFSPTSHPQAPKHHMANMLRALNASSSIAHAQLKPSRAGGEGAHPSSLEGRRLAAPSTSLSPWHPRHRARSARATHHSPSASSAAAPNGCDACHLPLRVRLAAPRSGC